MIDLKDINIDDFNAAFSVFLEYAQQDGKSLFTDALLRSDWKEVMNRLSDMSYNDLVRLINDTLVSSGYSSADEEVKRCYLYTEAGFLYNFFMLVDNFNIFTLNDDCSFKIQYGMDTIRFPSNVKELIIPSNVKKIPRMKFSSNTELERVIVESPSQLEEIDFGAFYNCSKLNKAILPNTIKNIGLGVFSLCDPNMEVILKGPHSNGVQIEIAGEDGSPNIQWWKEHAKLED